MPAPPYSAGTDTPSRPSSAICGRIDAIEPVLAIEIADARRDFRRPPSRGPSARAGGVLRTDRNPTCGCESSAQVRRSSTGSPTATPSRSAALADVRGALEVIGAAEQRADFSRRRYPRTSTRCARSSVPPTVSCTAPAPSVSLSHDRRSRFVTTLPNRSTRTTHAAQHRAVELAASAGRASGSR